jgi:hypothetical protein
MENEWRPMVFDIVEYRDTGTYIIRAADDILDFDFPCPFSLPNPFPLVMWVKLTTPIYLAVIGRSLSDDTINVFFSFQEAF